MIPIPAVDLKNGSVVRLRHGNFKEEKIYSGKAASVAKDFEKEGAQRLHVVDLDGALAGRPTNAGCVEEILSKVRIPVEVGGGIRDLDVAASYFRLGARWVILGTRVSMDKGFMHEAFSEFGEKVIIGVDALDGFIATDGWTHVTSLRAVEFAAQVQQLGGRTLIYTDISKDGVLKGPNLKGIESMCQALDIQLIASGGISSLEDISKLVALKQKNLSGVIIGTALYEKRFTLRQAFDACK